MTCLGSANRDPAKWGDTADRLDLRRADAQPAHVVRRRRPLVPRRAPRPARRAGRDRHARAPLPEARARDRHARVERPHRAPRPARASRSRSTDLVAVRVVDGGCEGRRPASARATRETDHAVRGPVVVRRVRPVLERVVVIGVPLDDDGESLCRDAATTRWCRRPRRRPSTRRRRSGRSARTSAAATRAGPRAPR